MTIAGPSDIERGVYEAVLASLSAMNSNPVPIFREDVLDAVKEGVHGALVSALTAGDSNPVPMFRKEVIAIIEETAGNAIAAALDDPGFRRDLIFAIADQLADRMDSEETP